jgi:hypothetical protein
MPTDNHISESFRPHQHPACRTPKTAPVSSASPPLEEARRRLKHHLDATSKHQPTPWPHHHGDANPATSTIREAKSWPSVASCRRGQPMPGCGQPWPELAGRGPPWPVVASRRRPSSPQPSSAAAAPSRPAGAAYARRPRTRRRRVPTRRINHHTSAPCHAAPRSGRSRAGSEASSHRRRRDGPCRWELRSRDGPRWRGLRSRDSRAHHAATELGEQRSHHHRPWPPHGLPEAPLGRRRSEER